MVGKLAAGDGVGPLEREFRAFARHVRLDLVAREPRAEGEDRALQHRVPVQPGGHEPEMMRLRPFILQLGVAEPPAVPHFDLRDAVDEIGAAAQPDMPLEDMRRAARLDHNPVTRLRHRAGAARHGRMDDLDGLFPDIPDGQRVAVARHGGVERDQRLSLRARPAVRSAPAAHRNGREVLAQEAVHQNDARPVAEERHGGLHIGRRRPEALASERAQARIFPRLDPVGREALRGEGLEGGPALARQRGADALERLAVSLNAR